MSGNRPVCVLLLGDSEIALWGLTGRERLARMLAGRSDVRVVADSSEVPAGGRLLLLRADFLFDPRLVSALLALEENTAVRGGESSDIAAVKTTREGADAARAILEGRCGKEAPEGLRVAAPADLAGAYDPRLLKYDPPTILPIIPGNRTVLEHELYNGSYKGVTDFITKWLWPRPARLAVGFCVRHRLSPNQVTLASLVLAIVAGLAFWQGFLVTGLLAGWMMTFLDTVDGKLARVTVNASRIGDVLDHGLDLLHPPLWYLAWAAGIAGTSLPPEYVMPLFWIVLGGYVGGRLCEGAFEVWLAPFRLFLWRPWDSFNRLFTARRNPNLVILTLSLIPGRPDIGLYLVAAWHLASTLILLWRLILAMMEKRRHGELRTWLSTIDPVKDRQRLAVRLFTRLSKSTTGSRQSAG